MTRQKKLKRTNPSTSPMPIKRQKEQPRNTTPILVTRKKVNLDNVN